MERVVAFLLRWASGKLVVGLFIATMAVYLTMLFFTIPAVESFAPGIALFDLSPGGYSYEHAVRLLDELGAEGRNVYRTVQLPMDFIYPGLFAITYSLLLTWIFSKTHAAGSKMFYFSIIPIFAGLFDYLENIGICRMLTSYPDVSHGLVSMTSTFTVLKSGFTVMFYVLLLVGAFQFLKKRFLSGGSPG